MDKPPIEFTVAARWREEAARPGGDSLWRLRLAAMAGHMGGDRAAARRGALIDLLADGRPHLREDILTRLAAELGDDLWGARPDEALLRDIAALRRGGIRIAYSRQPGTEGYYLQHPAIERGRPAEDQRSSVAGGSPDETWRRRIRALSVPEKNETAFAAADFALRQKRLILREEQPEQTAGQIDQAARRLVFGAGENG